jgi:hypothetical protein
MISSYLMSSLLFNALPTAVSRSIETVNRLLTQPSVVSDDVLRERILALDLECKLKCYKALLDDLNENTKLSNSVKIAVENVENALIKVDEILICLDKNLSKEPNGFYYISKLYFLEGNSEKMVMSLVVYTKILDQRFEYLIKLLNIKFVWKYPNPNRGGVLEDNAACA